MTKHEHPLDMARKVLADHPQTSTSVDTPLVSLAKETARLHTSLNRLQKQLESERERLEQLGGTFADASWTNRVARSYTSNQIRQISAITNPHIEVNHLA